MHAHSDSADVLSLVGDLDVSGASRFVVQAGDALRQGATRLVIELGDVPYIDSAGLAALLNVLRRVRSAGAAMVLVSVQPHVRELLDQTQLDREFTFANSLDEAEAALN